MSECEGCDGSGWVSMPDHNGVPFWSIRRLRFWLIKKLARGDLIYINTITEIPNGWAINKKDLDQGMLVCHNAFATMEWIAPPGTRALWRIDDEV